jgi:hypothetical protein
MHFVDVFFANGAEITPDGRFHVIGGGFEIMLIPPIGGTLQILYMVARIHFEPAECQKPYSLQVTATRPDGSDMGVVGVQPLNPDISKYVPEIGTTLQIAIGISNLLIPSAGFYTFTLTVEGQSVAQALTDQKRLHFVMRDRGNENNT